MHVDILWAEYLINDTSGGMTMTVSAIATADDISFLHLLWEKIDSEITPNRFDDTVQIFFGVIQHHALFNDTMFV
jgi:molybdate-binding protein